MAADPRLEPQNPMEGVGGPQEAPQEPSEGYLDANGHPSQEYVAGCCLKAIEACKDAFLAAAEEPEAAQKYGAGAFGFAQAWEKISGKASAEPDPVKLAQLEEKAREHDVKQGLAASKQLDDSAHKDQQASQDAAKAVLDHGQKQQQAQDRANQPEKKPGG